jgi:cytochrome c
LLLRKKFDKNLYLFSCEIKRHKKQNAQPGAKKLNLMRGSRHLLRKISPLLIGCLLFASCYLLCCDNKPEQKHNKEASDYIKQIPGKNDSIPVEVAKKGEVLIFYSDCYLCHKKDRRSVGPAFRDIAKRYPVNKVYIEMLAHKVIIGGSGSWGTPVMDPHPKLSLEDAKMMVTYILSMKK